MAKRLLDHRGFPRIARHRRRSRGEHDHAQVGIIAHHALQPLRALDGGRMEPAAEYKQVNLAQHDPSFVRIGHGLAPEILGEPIGVFLGVSGL